MVPFWEGAPPILVYFSGDWDVHVGYGVLTHGQILQSQETPADGSAVLVVRGQHRPLRVDVRDAEGQAMATAVMVSCPQRVC